MFVGALLKVCFDFYILIIKEQMFTTKFSTEAVSIPLFSVELSAIGQFLQFHPVLRWLPGWKIQDLTSPAYPMWEKLKW